MKKLSVFVCVLVLMFGVVGISDAWYFEIAPGPDYNGYPAVELTWHGDPGDQLGGGIFFALDSANGASLNCQYTPTIGTVWEPTGVDPAQDGSVVYNLSAVNPSDDPFNPGPTVVLDIVAYNSDPGSVWFVNYLDPLGGPYTSVGVNGEVYRIDNQTRPGYILGIFDGGTKLGEFPIPIPGGIFLVAFGLVGLIGLKRIMR